MNEEVKKLYNELFNSKEALSEDEFLDKLIKIENIVKYNIYHTLLSYTTKNDIKDLIKLYWEQIVKSKSALRNKLERQSLERLIGEKITIWEILDKYINRIKKVFAEKTSLDNKLSSLKIAYDYIDWVIFPPEWDTRIQPWSWKWLNIKEWYDRISILFNDILNINNNFYLWDFRVIIGKDDNNSLRRTSYVVIEIPKLNKTIFVNNKYWEATYIYNWIPTDKDLLTKWKESLKNECTKISFHNSEQRKNQIINILFNKESQNNGISYENIKAKDLKNALDMEEKKEKIRIALNEKQAKEKRFSLYVNQRESFKLNDWTSYTIIARTFGITEVSKNIFKNKIFIELSKRIFGENDPDVINFMKTHIEHTQDSIREIFKNNEQLKKLRFSLKIKERREFKLHDWTGYIAIVTIFGFKENKKDLLKINTFIELSKEIFGENDPDVINLVNNNISHTVDSIKEIFKNNEQLKKQRFSLGYAQRDCFRLEDWTSYTNIARIFGITAEWDDLKKHEMFVELTKRIFWENDSDVINLTKKYVFHTIDSIKNIFLKDRELKEERFLTNPSKRTRFKLEDWTTYIDIARIFWFKENHRDLVKDEMFIEVSKKIFWEDDPNITNYINRNVKHNTDSIRAIFANNKQFKKEWFSLNIVWRIKFKLSDWTTYRSIARIFDIKEDKNDLYTMKTFIELCRKIFGEEDSDVVNLVNNNVFHTVDSIKSIFTNDGQLKKEWFSLNFYIQRRDFKLSDWTTYLAIARIFGFNGIWNDIFKDKIFIELSKKIFWENDPNVINFINSHVEHNIDSIKAIFLNNDKLKKERFSLDSNQRKDFKLNDWTSYVIIARIFWLKEKRDDLQKEKPFIELSKRIFGGDDSDVINLANNYVVHEVNTIKAIFTNNEQLKKQRFSLKVQERSSFKLVDWISYTNIARIFWFTEDGEYLVKNKVFIELSKKIFGEDDSDVIDFMDSHVEHTEDSIKEIFKNDNQLKKQRFSLSTIQRAKFKLNDWTSYIVIARIFGFKERENHLIKDNTFIALSKRIFGEDDTDVINFTNPINCTKNTFSNNKQLKDERFSLKVQERSKFKLPNWTSYVNIARIFGFIEEKGDLFKDEIFIELSKKIFWENDSDVINLIDSCEKHTMDSIKNIFQNNEQLMEYRFSMKVKQRERFNLGDWTGYTTIARIFGLLGERKDFAKDKRFLELSRRIFGEDDPNVIELAKRLNK